jgi:prepilin-type processing-associated H-X9-DG protein
MNWGYGDPATGAGASAWSHVASGIPGVPSPGSVFSNPNLSQIQSPSTTVLVTDADGYATERKWADINDPNGIMQSALGPDPVGGPGQRWLYGIIERHLETTNILYCDGHVKAQKLDYLLTANNTTPQRTVYTTIAADPN